MKIKFLGTSASEGIPGVFCDCENCRKSRELGGRNIRSRSQSLINGNTLIDFPQDTFHHLVTNNIDMMDINYCIITHAHDDHYCQSEIVGASVACMHPRKDWHFELYGSKDIATVEPYTKRGGGRFSFHSVKPFEPFKVGELEVTALNAVHGTEHPYIYLISDGKKTLFYALDSDYYPEDSWEYIAKTKPMLDMVVFDCAECNTPVMDYVGHGCMNTNDEMRKRLSELGCVHENTKYVLDHFSHNGLDSVYDILKPIAEKRNFIVSYDGLELDV